MLHGKYLSAFFIFCCSIMATQIVTEVELARDKGVIFNQSGEIAITNERWMYQQKFDFSLELGDCPTVCGVHCPLDILSKEKFYIYKANQDSFPLYGCIIDLQNDDFYISSQYQNHDTIQFFTIPLEDYPKYMIFKSTVNKYFLFIIDSLKIRGGCDTEDPACCSAYGIDKIYGKIIFQNNGLPFFDQVVPVKRKKDSKHYKLNSGISSRVIDIQGRSISSPRNSSGIRISISSGNNLKKKRNVKTYIK